MLSDSDEELLLSYALTKRYGEEKRTRVHEINEKKRAWWNIVAYAKSQSHMKVAFNNIFASSQR